MQTEKTLQNIVDDWGKRTPNREAIFDGKKRISYGELYGEIHRLASSLYNLGIRKNDKLMIMLPNWYEFVVLYIALAKLGAVVVPCNCALKGHELERRIDLIYPKAVFVSNPIQLSLFSQYNIPFIITTRFKEPGYYSYDELILSAKPQKERDTHFDEADPRKDLYAILFTSGSTGFPKGVQLTSHNLFQSTVQIGNRIHCSNEDTVLFPLPCGHTFGLLAGVIMPLYFGAKIVLMEKHSPSEALNLIGQEKATVHLGVPTMFIRELELLDRFTKKNLSFLRTGIVSGAAFPENVMKQIYYKLGMEITNLYGSTEAMGISMTSLSCSLEKRFGTSGFCFEGVNVKVVDEKGRPVGRGTIGELVVKGEGLMKGYYKMPHETAKAINGDGWFYTGDLVTIDSSNYIKIVGRKKDLIIRGGNNIVPAEVEEIYFSHPSVSEVIVFGVPDKVLGEQICACFTLKNNSQETEMTLKEYAKNKIAKYKIPDHIFILPEMPRLENGKINKKFLIEYYKEALTAALS